MSYHVYKTGLDRMRAYFKANAPKSLRRKVEQMTDDQLLQMAEDYSAQNGLTRTIDNDVLPILTELAWAEAGRKTFFVTRDVCEWLNTCRFDFSIQDYATILHGHVSCFNFENGSTFRGVPVTCGLLRVGREHYLQLVRRATSLPGRTELTSGYTMAQALSDRSQFDVSVIRPFGPDEKAHDTITQTQLNTPLDPLKDFMEGGGRILENGRLKEATARSYATITASLASLIYVSAFPEALHEGPPKEFKQSAKRSQTIVAVDKICVRHNEHGSPCTHWRRGHFRTLRAERFSRNEDGSPRVIFVHDMLVARKGQNVHTIQDPEPEEETA